MLSVKVAHVVVCVECTRLLLNMFVCLSLSFTCLSLLVSHRLLSGCFSLPSLTLISLSASIFGDITLFFFFPFDWWSLSSHSLYWSLKLWSFFSLLPPFSLCSFPNFVFSLIYPGELLFICQKCPARPETTLFHHIGCISFCLMVFFPSYSTVSSTLTAARLQLLSCFSSDAVQVHTVWAHNATQVNILHTLSVQIHLLTTSSVLPINCLVSKLFRIRVQAVGNDKIH